MRRLDTVLYHLTFSTVLGSNIILRFCKIIKIMRKRQTTQLISRLLQSSLLTSSSSSSLSLQKNYYLSATTSSHLQQQALKLSSPSSSSTTKRFFSTNNSNSNVIISESEGGMMEEQWKLWPYFEESIEWHSDWLRLDADTGEVKEHFQGLRDFQAIIKKKGDDDRTDDDTTETKQHNTYMYGDERGTVSDGPLCGPWFMNKQECSSLDGMIHTARPFMRTLLGPDRSAVWMMKELPTLNKPSPSGFELFLGDGKFLRLSVGIVYDPTGKLQQLSAIREDSRGFDQGYWTTNDVSMTVLETVPTEFIDTLSSLSSSSSSSSLIEVKVPGPVQTTKQGNEIDLKSLKFLNVQQEEDTIFQLPDNIFVICPRQLPTLVADNDDSSKQFWIAAGWKKDDGTLTSTIEAKYDNMGHMEKMVHTKILLEN